MTESLGTGKKPPDPWLQVRRSFPAQGSQLAGQTATHPPPDSLRDQHKEVTCVEVGA